MMCCGREALHKRVGNLSISIVERECLFFFGVLGAMGKPRTKRKNAQKRKARRVFAAVADEIQAAVDAKWTPEEIERERMENEEERQRVHDEWRRAVAASKAAFEKRKRIKEERQRLLRAIRQRLESGGNNDE